MRSITRHRAYGVGTMADHQRHARRLYGCGGLKNVINEWSPRDMVKYFRQLRLHPRPLTGRKHHDMDVGSRHIGRYPNFLARSITE